MICVKVKCVLCGKEEEINKLHKDYKKLAANPHAAYYCQTCSLRLSYEANREADPLGRAKS